MFKGTISLQYFVWEVVPVCLIPFIFVGCCLLNTVNSCYTIQRNLWQIDRQIDFNLATGILYLQYTVGFHTGPGFTQLAKTYFIPALPLTKAVKTNLRIQYSTLKLNLNRSVYVFLSLYLPILCVSGRTQEEALYVLMNIPSRNREYGSISTQ